MMDYEIRIEIAEVGGIYTAENMEKAQEIAQSICDDIYSRLGEKYGVVIESVEEL